MRTRNTFIMTMLTVWALIASVGWVLQANIARNQKDQEVQTTKDFSSLAKGKDYYVNPRVDKKGYRFCDIIRLTAAVESGVKPQFRLTYIRGQEQKDNEAKKRYCWSDFESAVDNDRQ